MVEGEEGVERELKKEEVEKGKEAEVKVRKVEVKGVKRPPRAQRVKGRGREARRNGSKEELREGEEK